MSLNLSPSELLSLATTFRLPDSAIPAFHLSLRDDPEAPQYNGPVEWTVSFLGSGWAILDNNNCLGRNGLWTMQRLPSARTEEFFAVYRWPTAEVALEAACIAARLYPNGSSCGNEPPWGLRDQWKALWSEYRAEKKRQVSAFAAGLLLP